MKILSGLMVILLTLSPAVAVDISPPILDSPFHSLNLIIQNLHTTIVNIITIERQPHSGELQGTYTIPQEYLSLFPFTTIAVLNPSSNKWYTITREDNNVIILDHLTPEPPQYYIYPTPTQLQSLKDIAGHVSKGGLTIQDKIQLIELWYDIQKIEVIK